jgi:hypothetical protein
MDSVSEANLGVRPTGETVQYTKTDDKTDTLPVKVFTDEELKELDRIDAAKKVLRKEVKDEFPEITDFYLEELLNVYFTDDGKSLYRMMQKHKLDKRIEEKTTNRKKIST